jgi:D-glycero-D-manno-heptose 1,7-bisphosphate phosphatase
MNKGVFIDRDGTINKEVKYLADPSKFEFIPGALDALLRLQKKGYKLILVTNQAGVAKGKLTLRQLDLIHLKMLGLMQKAGVHFTKEEIYICPHREEEDCECRKPKIKSLLHAQIKYGLDPKLCFMVGDKTSDIEAGKRAGYGTILVSTGYGGKDGKYQVEPDYAASDLLAASKIILNNADV